MKITLGLDRLRSVPAVLAIATWLYGVGAAGAASAQTLLPIVNPSFELPAIPAGTFATTAPPPGWSPIGSLDFGFRTIGVLHPATTTLYLRPAPHRRNVGVVFLLDDQNDQTIFAGSEAGMRQVLDAVLAPNTRYTLSVAVGNIGNDPNPPHNQFLFTGFPGYRIELLAGGQRIAADLGTLLPDEAGFRTSVTRVTTGPFHRLAGRRLEIRLINLNAAPGLEVNFDDVRLEAEPAPPLPLLAPPGAYVLALAAYFAGVSAL